jgi:hypothetical protein
MGIPISERIFIEKEKKKEEKTHRCGACKQNCLCTNLNYDIHFCSDGYHGLYKILFSAYIKS